MLWSHAVLNIKSLSPKNFFSVDTSGVGQAGRDVQEDNGPTSKTDQDQTSADSGEDGTFTELQNVKSFTRGKSFSPNQIYP